MSNARGSSEKEAVPTDDKIEAADGVQQEASDVRSGRPSASEQQRNDKPRATRTRLINLLTPPTAVYDKTSFNFSLVRNVFFGTICTVIVAQPYYIQSLLVVVADDFSQSYDTVATLPTLALGGTALGLLTLVPAADFVNRRYLIMAMVAVSIPINLAIALSPTFAALQALHFLLGLFSAVAQILQPLVVDICKPEKRAQCLGVMLAGVITGVIFARAISGVIAEFSSWRNVYFLSTGLAAAMLVMVWLWLPDVPLKPHQHKYWRIPLDLVAAPYRFPALWQTLAIAFCSACAFMSFFVTLTFLLNDYYGFSELQIGLFNLIGLVGIGLAPLAGRLIDCFHPWLGTMLGIGVGLVTWSIEIGIGGISLAGPVITIVLLDLANQLVVLTTRVRVFEMSVLQRSRLNSVVSIFSFCGQLAGASLGTRIYTSFGWRATAAFGLGLYILDIAIMCLRGPRGIGYLGWNNSFSFRKSDLDVVTDDAQDAGRQNTSVIREGDEKIRNERV